MSRTAQDIIEIGRELIEAKPRTERRGGRQAHLVPNNGEGFERWINREFGMAIAMAQNFMNVARQFGGQEAQLSGLTPTAIYALAEPSTPEEVRASVIERAAAGETVTVAEVRELKAKVREKSADHSGSGSHR